MARHAARRSLVEQATRGGLQRHGAALIAIYQSSRLMPSSSRRDTALSVERSFLTTGPKDNFLTCPLPRFGVNAGPTMIISQNCGRAAARAHTFAIATPPPAQTRSVIGCRRSQLTSTWRGWDPQMFC
jgi:hypothetical protein